MYHFIMKKNIILYIFWGLLPIQAFAQQNAMSWRIGVHGGTMGYYGDLNRNWESIFSPRMFLQNPKKLDFVTYGISIENTFSRAWSWKLTAMRGAFEANDRKTDWNKKLLPDGENFDRSLNARTQINDAALLMSYYFDNGNLLSKKSFLAPYVFAGVGVTNFNVAGDLFDANGNKYYYWTDNTIRNAPQSTDPNAAIIEQDGKFETNLTKLRTEKANGYSTTVLHIPVGLGLKFRLGSRWNLNLECAAKYTMTDYLDDVAGTYRSYYDNTLQEYAANPNHQTGAWRGTADDKVYDIYGTATLSLHYNFGYKTSDFNAPVFYSISKGEEFFEKDTLEKPIVNTPDNPIQKDSIFIIEKKEEKQPDKKPSISILPENYPHISTDQTPQNSIKEYKEKILIILNEKGDTLRKEKSIEKSYKKGVQEESNSLNEFFWEQKPTVKKEIEEIKIINEKNPTIVLEKQEPIVLPSLPAKSVERLSLEEIQSTRKEVAELKEEVLTLRSPEKTNAPAVNTKELETLEKRMDSLDKKMTEYLVLNRWAGQQTPQQSSTIIIDGATKDLEKEVKTLREQINMANAPAPMTLTWDEYKKMQTENENKIKILEQELVKAKSQPVVTKVEVPKTPVPITVPSALPPPQLATDDAELKKILYEIETLRKNPTKKRDKADLNRLNNKLLEINSRIAYQQATDKRNDAATQSYLDALNKQMLDMQAALQQMKTENEATVLAEERKQAAVSTASQEIINRQQAEINQLKSELQRTKDYDALKAKTELLEQNQKNTIPTAPTVVTIPSNNNQELIALKQQLEELKTIMANKKPETTIITAPAPVITPASVLTNRLSPAEEAMNMNRSTNIYFEIGSATISTSFYERLDKMANVLQQFPELNIRLKGYADKSGNATNNMILSEKRTRIVANYFTGRGVSMNRIQIAHYGDQAASQANDPFFRRVEVELYK